LVTFCISLITNPTLILASTMPPNDTFMEFKDEKEAESSDSTIPYEKQKEIAERLMAEFGGDFEKACVYIRALCNARTTSQGAARSEMRIAESVSGMGRSEIQQRTNKLRADAARAVYMKLEAEARDAYADEAALYAWWNREGKAANRAALVKSYKAAMEKAMLAKKIYGDCKDAVAVARKAVEDAGVVMDSVGSDL
jgi:hypothetical protein